MKKPYLRLLAILAMGAFATSHAAPQNARPNVLFIVLDDLGPYLGCYGESQVISPNIDQLAARGLLFDRAYCQQAICSPSRVSLLTGLRPDTTKVYDLSARFRDVVPDVVTLPQDFKNNGYHTQALGKIFHAAFDRNDTTPKGEVQDDPQSWSVPTWRGGPRYYYTDRGVAEARRVFAGTSGASVASPRTR